MEEKIHQTVLYAKLSGPITSLSIATSNEEESNLIAIGYSFYIDLGNNQRVLICRACSNEYFLVYLQRVIAPGSDILNIKISEL